MTTSKLATVFSLCATLLISTGCGKKTTATVKRAVPAASASSPAPSPGSSTAYALLQGSWTENCESDTNQQWTEKINGDVASYSGVLCGTNTAVSGGFTKKFKLDNNPSSSDFQAHITYLNDDGTTFYEEDITGTTEPLALSFSSDDTTYFHASY